MKYRTSSIFILSVLILCLNPAAADIVKVWDAENNTAWIYHNGILRGQVESRSIISDLTYFQETLTITAHNSDYVFDINDFQYTIQYIKSNTQITGRTIERERSESYIVTVPDYGDVQHNQVIPDIQSYNDISDTWVSADGLDLGDEDSIFKYEVNFIHPVNGTTIGIIGFDSYEIITSNPLKINFIWSEYEVIDNHDEERTRKVWMAFNPQGKTLNAGTTYHVRITLLKQAELGPVSILVIPSIFGADIEELTYWNTTFNYRKFVTYNQSAISGSHTNIPLQYYFTQDGINDNGTDIRLTYENGTQTPREIEFYNSSINNGSLFFIANTSDTGFWMYWGNPSATEPAEDSAYGKEAVWDYNYVGVWHMNTYDPLLDSTSYDHDGAKGTGIDASNLVNSDIGYGKGINFENTVNDKFTVTHTADLDLNHNTIEMSGTQDSNPDNYPGALMKVGAYGMFKSKSTHATYPSRFVARAWKTTVAKDAVDTVVMPLGSPYYWVGRYDGTNEKLYFDSAERGTVAVTSPIDTSANNLIIGIYPAAGYWDGIISELRLSKISRSTNYINTTCKNLKNPTATGTSPFYNSTGEIQYYAGSLHYNTTSNYNHTIESDGTITANQTVYPADDINDTAQSTGTSYLIINVYNNTASIVRNLTVRGNNLDWYQAANLSYGYTLNNASGVIESQNAVGGLVNFTTDLIPGTYTIEIIQPPQNLTNITEQTQICYNWDDYANADYWNISQRIASIPYTDVKIILDGTKDTEFTDRAHTWILNSPNPTGTNGDKELISWIRNSTTLSGYADGEDNDALNNDDIFKIMLDMTANNLTTDDRQFILSESGTVTAMRWNGIVWVPQATNAAGVVIGAGVAGSIHYEMQIPISELTNFNNGSTIKLAMERKDTSQNPDVIKYYPKTLINDTDATIWTSINLTAESEYIFLGNTTLSNYTVTGLTPFSWYRHRFSTINGSSESSYVYSNDITEDSSQYTISGYILTEADLPISGATVWSVCGCGCVCEVETSNATGYYQGDCFYNSTYTIYAIAAGYLENFTVVIVTGANRSNQNITLTLTPSITISPAAPVQYDEFDLPLLLYIFIISFLYLFIVFRNGIAATELSLIYLLFIFFMLLFQTISLSVNYIYIPAFIFLFQVSITGINLERKGGD